VRKQGHSALTLAVLRRKRRGMATTAGPAGVAAPRRRNFDLESWARNRQRYLDNLNVVLIAMIIAIHGVLSYDGFDQLWSYADVQEVTFSPVTEVILFAVIGPFALFMIALLFLVAGLLTRPSLERKDQGALLPTGYYGLGCRSLCSLSACGRCSCTRCTIRSAQRPDRIGRSSVMRAATSTPARSGSWVCC
jgi:hypothetical protein